MDILTILVAVTMLEALNETLKMVYEKNKFNVTILISVVVGIAFAFAIDAKLLAAVGVNTMYPMVDNIVTGILLSRGSTFVHELTKKITDLSKSNK